MSKKILINVRPNQTRVAYLDKDRLIDFQIEQKTSPTLVGGIYKGRVSRVLPGMQAAFVDIGLDKSAFLYVGDVAHGPDASPDTRFEEELESESDALPLEPIEGKAHPPIQELLTQGQMILCQVAKDPLGTKGARITTYISLPGRLVVYTPNMTHVGVSKKIEDEEERNRLSDIVKSAELEGGGVIVRTAAEGLSEKQITEDLAYLNRLWKDVSKNFGKRKKIGCLYKDLDLGLRALRDYLSDEVSEVIIDRHKSYKKASAFINQFMPRFKNRTQYYNQPKPLFDHYNIDLEISRSLGRRIWLKSGGYLVFDEAEALVVIDVNTGRYVGKKDLDETILQTNLEAAHEIAHQLRIRNCGGIIIVDFIDMEKEVHKEQVLNLFREELAADRAKIRITDISELGLVEMTRKRTRQSLVRTLTKPCTYCEGRGYIKKRMTIANEIFRALEREAETVLKTKKPKVYVECHSDVADWIYEEDPSSLDFIEGKLNTPVIFKVNKHLHIEEYSISVS